MTKKDLIQYAERAADEAADRLAVAGAMGRFAEAGEIDLAERARKLLEAGERKRRP